MYWMSFYAIDLICVWYKCGLFPGTNNNMGRVGTWGEMSCNALLPIIVEYQLSPDRIQKDTTSPK